MTSKPRTAHPIHDGVDFREPCTECGHTAKYHEGPAEYSEPRCYFESTVSGAEYTCPCAGWPMGEEELDEVLEGAKAYLTALNLTPEQQGNLAGWLMGEAAHDLIAQVGKLFKGE